MRGERERGRVREGGSLILTAIQFHLIYNNAGNIRLRTRIFNNPEFMICMSLSIY